MDKAHPPRRLRVHLHVGGARARRPKVRGAPRVVGRGVAAALSAAVADPVADVPPGCARRVPAHCGRKRRRRRGVGWRRPGRGRWRRRELPGDARRGRRHGDGGRRRRARRRRRRCGKGWRVGNVRRVWRVGARRGVARWASRSRHARRGCRRRGRPRKRWRYPLARGGAPLLRRHVGGALHKVRALVVAEAELVVVAARRARRDRARVGTLPPAIARRDHLPVCKPRHLRARRRHVLVVHRHQAVGARELYRARSVDLALLTVARHVGRKGDLEREGAGAARDLRVGRGGCEGGK